MLILIHYNEIGLKGENRWIFEEQLVRNIKAALEDTGGIGECAVKRERGRIVVRMSKSEFLRLPKPEPTLVDKLSNETIIHDNKLQHYVALGDGGQVISNKISNLKSQITEKLKKVFGIAYFAFAFEARITAIGSVPLAINIKRIIAEVYGAYRSSNKSNKSDKSNRSDRSNKSHKTFRIETKRSDKSFPLTSQELNEKLGEFIRKKTKMKVDLDHPDIVFFLEIVKEKFYIYFEKIKGFGGLPVGASGRVLAMISSGIDSPVAAWYLMKRGASVDFIHFHSWPQTSRASIENVKKITGVLRRYQNKCHLYLVPLLDIQKEIIKKAPEDYRVIMYRYFMFIIANAIAHRPDRFYQALVTGESLGQVASQTLDNIRATHKSLMGVLPVFRPLIGMNKEEIIKKARQIGTYEFSIKPYDDCCGLFVPKHPVTKAESETILEIAKKIDKKRITQILKNIEIINF